MSKETKEKVSQAPSKKEITSGKKVHLHKYYKGIAAGFIDKAQRRQFINMMLDATVAQIKAKQREVTDKDISDKDQ